MFAMQRSQRFARCCFMSFALMLLLWLDRSRQSFEALVWERFTLPQNSNPSSHASGVFIGLSSARQVISPLQQGIWTHRDISQAVAAAVEFDSDVLQKGIDLAIEKKLVPAVLDIEPCRNVALVGKSADEVAGEIVAALGDTAMSGGVVVLSGPPCEEKKAVLSALQRTLPKTELWTIATFFRAMTFLLLTMTQQTGGSLKDVLQQPFMLAAGIEMIEEMREGRSIGELVREAEGMMGMSSDAQNIEKNLPLALEYGQGEVIKFVNDALAKTAGGVTVLLDGPEETLKYVRTPHRFNLA